MIAPYSLNFRAAGLFLAICAAQGVSAATLQVTGMDLTRGEQFDISKLGAQDPENLGVVQGIFNSVTIDPLFCLDIFTEITVATYNTTLLAPRASRHEDRAAWLLNAELPKITNSLYGAALQLAIWDIVHDNGDGLSSGSVQSYLNAADPNKTPANVIALANTFLAESFGQSSENATVYLNTEIASGAPAQALLSVFVPGTPQVTDPPLAGMPEPSTWILSGGAILALAVLNRKR